MLGNYPISAIFKIDIDEILSKLPLPPDARERFSIPNDLTYFNARLFGDEMMHQKCPIKYSFCPKKPISNEICVFLDPNSY